jgi:hypothetical protein
MNELQKIVSEIQYRTQKTIPQIAVDINYSREHLTREINKGDSVAIKDLLVKKYKKYLVDYLSDESMPSMVAEEHADISRNGVKEIDIINFEKIMIRDLLLAKAMLRAVLRNQAELLAKQRGVKVTTVLSELTKAIESEISTHFDEL